MLCRINKLHYILHLNVFSHFTFESEIGFGQNHILEICTDVDFDARPSKEWIGTGSCRELSSDM